MAGELRREVDRSFGLQDAVDIASQRGPVVGGRRGVEGSEGVHRLGCAWEQGDVLVRLRGDGGEAIEATGQDIPTTRQLFENRIDTVLAMSG